MYVFVSFIIRKRESFLSARRWLHFMRNVILEELDLRYHLNSTHCIEVCGISLTHRNKYRRHGILFLLSLVYGIFCLNLWKGSRVDATKELD
jgi:hypothetical protein